jgi:hypothetical protein
MAIWSASAFELGRFADSMPTDRATGSKQLSLQIAYNFAR